MSYPNWIFSLFSFLGFVLVCIPLPWHLEAWNTGTCLYMVWTAVACLNQFINSIAWNGNAINWAPAWCDISTRIILGTTVAIPSALLCINRRLYHIAAVRSVTITKAEKRRQIMVDLSIGLGLPILGIALAYIPQGNRFNILEDIGCYPAIYITWVSLVLVSAPPIAIGLVSAVYAVLSIRAFNITRSQSKQILSASSNLTSSRYFRLMALAGTDLICTVPLAVYAMIISTANGALNPWVSWANTHFDFSRVDQYPSLIWRFDKGHEATLEFGRWLPIICAFVFFGFFGFADEAKKNYRSAMGSVAKRVGYSTGSFGGKSTGFGSSSSMSKSGTGSQPGFLPTLSKERFVRRNSCDVSFSDASSSLKNASERNTPIDEKKNTGFTSVFAGKKKLGEEVFKPSFHYDDLVLPDIGGTLVPDHSSADDTLSVPSSGSSSASSISFPEPAVAHSEAGSLHHSSRTSLPLDIPMSVSVAENPLRHSHDMV